MQPITKQKYFYFISFMVMASTFLPLVFFNLPRVIGSHHLWTLIWVVSLLVFNPQIFVKKVIVYLLAYGLFLFLAIKTIWSTIDYNNSVRLFFEFYEISIGVTIITYYNQSMDYLSLAKLTRWSIVFLFITATMTIVTVIMDPMYARNLTGLAAVSNKNEIDTILRYERYGGGTYSTAAVFMCLFPIIIYYYKNISLSLISKKQLIVFSLFISIALIGMQIFGNILIAVIFCTIALLGMRKLRRSILVIVLFCSILLLIPQRVYVNSFLMIRNYFEMDSEMYHKVNDIAVFFESGADIKDNSTGLSTRAARYPLLLKSFSKSPFLGCYFFSDNLGNGYDLEGAHLYWMNKLTVTGIVGLCIFLIIPYRFIRNSLKNFSSSYKFYYVLASLAILCYGLMKVIGGRDTWYAFFIILPGLYYLPLLKKIDKPNLTVDNS
jgi:hypothetical protein